jgi:hypothetical protein
LTESWNWLPVVERMVIAPSSESETVPDVYVVWEFAIPEMAVCVSGCTDCVALIRQPELEAATVIIPAPAMERVRASYVPEEVPDVFEIA